MVEKREAGVFCIDAIKALLGAQDAIGKRFRQRMAEFGEVRGDLWVLVEATGGLAETAHSVCPLPDPLRDCPMLNGKPCQIREIVSQAERDEIYV